VGVLIDSDTHGLGIVTRNRRDFERLPGLRVVAA
jgi:predicted nucleic acid-binding protein